MSKNVKTQPIKSDNFSNMTAKLNNDKMLALYPTDENCSKFFFCLIITVKYNYFFVLYVFIEQFVLFILM